MEKCECSEQTGIQMAARAKAGVYTNYNTKSLIWVLTGKPNLFFQLYSEEMYQHLVKVWIKAVSGHFWSHLMGEQWLVKEV
jgi:hypothetical protein